MHNAHRGQAIHALWHATLWGVGMQRCTLGALGIKVENATVLPAHHVAPSHSACHSAVARSGVACTTALWHGVMRHASCGMGQAARHPFVL